MAANPLLTIIATLRPEAWDAIIPHGPFQRTRAELASHSLAALNPQPLPPVEVAFTVGAAQMAHDLARLALEAHVAGGPTGFLGEIIDDWCGTHWPRKWPWPWPGPRPDEDVLTDLVDIQAGRVAGAIVFASYAARLGEGELADVLSKGADRLADVAVGG